MSELKHTLALFERLVVQVPPLVPEDLKQNISQALEQAQSNMRLSVDQLEETMIYFGKQLWPYREAFLEFYRLAESEVYEKFLLKKLSFELKNKYQAYLDSGRTFRDFHNGKDFHFLSKEERGELCNILILVNKDVWNFTVQRVLGLDNERYKKRIKEFQKMLKDIEKKIELLHEMADSEREHPELVTEIREHIKNFEYGIALLGPKLNYEAVCVSEDHFEERRIQKKLHKARM